MHYNPKPKQCGHLARTELDTIGKETLVYLSPPCCSPSGAFLAGSSVFPRSFRDGACRTVHSLAAIDNSAIPLTQSLYIRATPTDIYARARAWEPYYNNIYTVLYTRTHAVAGNEYNYSCYHNDHGCKMSTSEVLSRETLLSPSLPAHGYYYDPAQSFAYTSAYSGGGPGAASTLLSGGLTVNKISK